MFIEIFKYKEKILKQSKLENDELLLQLQNILTRIKFINENHIPRNIFNKAYKICKAIDEKDTPFVALSLFLNGTILTGDKKLIKGLKDSGFTNVMELKDILNMLD
jgi:predicted nucleic acid-binding protein